MTAVQMGLTIAVCTAATMLTRFLPFVVFSSKDQQPPEMVRYLGRVLPNLDALIENFDNALSHPDAEDLERLKQAVK